MTYDNTNRAVLFKNDRKKEERDPDYRGSINIQGVDHWFDGWVHLENGIVKRINAKIGGIKQASKPKDDSNITW